MFLIIMGYYRYTVDDLSMDEHSGTYRCTVGTMVPGYGLLERFSEFDVNVQSKFSSFLYVTTLNLQNFKQVL